MIHAAFKEIVWAHYRTRGRSLPWRKTRDPYKIFISELMLQQTQVDRVREKYAAWMKAFPDWRTLAAAELRTVLELWSGLGYNRRAKYAHEAAKAVMEKYKGKLSRDFTALKALPGIGPYTAGAICAFAFNLPQPIIETNIRTVFIHHFFAGREKAGAKGGVSDTEIMPLIEKTLDRGNPREWYWALMDYGAHLKKTIGNKNVQSKHYMKQSKFIGSDRQIRGAVLRALLQKKRPAAALTRAVSADLKTDIDPARLAKILKHMTDEKIIKKIRNSYEIS